MVLIRQQYCVRSWWTRNNYLIYAPFMKKSVGLHMRNSEILQGKLKTVVKTGEVPYQANKRALKRLDIQNDGEKGMREVNLLLAGIGLFIEDLEDLSEASRGVAKKALASIR